MRKVHEKISDSGRVALRCGNQRISFHPRDAGQVTGAIAVLDRRDYEYEAHGFNISAIDQLSDYITDHFY